MQVTYPNGSVWRYEWNEQGLLVKQISPLGAETCYEYDEYGQPTSVIDPMGSRTELVFDKLGNPIGVTDALGHTTKLSYNALGNVTARIDPMGRETKYTYDKKGRLVKAQLPGGAKIACEYDPENNLVSYQDENGAVTRLDYCGLNELKRRIHPDGQVVEYHYDTQERLTALTNQRGERYELKRDALGRIIGEVDYWGQERKYEYTPAGHLAASMDPLGQTIRYQTDPLGRIVEKIMPDPRQPKGIQTETFEYDDNGYLVACRNENIRVDRKYDKEGRLVEERQGDSVISYSYDQVGNRIARETKIWQGDTLHTQTVNYKYDSLGQAIAIEIPGHDPIQLKRNAGGQVTNEILSGSLKRFFSYTDEGYLAEQDVLNAEGSVFKQEYQYDRAGNLVSIMDSVLGADKFHYDPLGRIITHINPEHRVKKYLHDPAGDLLRTRIETEDGQWSREGTHEGTAYKFDRAGNLVERKGREAETRFVWDANGRLVESYTDGRVTEYAYDPFGRRIGKTTDGLETRFYWDGDALLGDISDERQREWVYYPGSFEPLAMVQGEELYLYHNDPNGLPTRLLEPNGNVVWAARYDAWGQMEKLVIDEVDQPLRLQGQYFDEETGLHYNRFRYYSPEIGAFVSQDPLGLQAGENVYAFAPNTQKWIDPLGLCREPKDSIPLKNNSVRKLLNSRGLSKQQARDVVESFDGQIYATKGRTGEIFTAVESTPGKASYIFVTRGSAGATPADRIRNLALPPSNTANVESTVRLTRDQILLEGKVAPQLRWGADKTGGGWQVVTDGGKYTGAVERVP